MMRFCAGIVTYNPDINRLKENISAVSEQVDIVVIVDNASSNINEILLLSETFNNVSVIRNIENRGIAVALNQIMNAADESGYGWALLLDQDSVVTANLISSYSKLIGLDKAAIICPQIYDINSQNKLNVQDSVTEIGVCITSGSLTNVKIWKKLGKFDEKLFIDSVDSEYCIRLFFEGFKIYRANNIQLLHELGKTEKHLYKSATNHSAMRRYFIARNSTYVAKKYGRLAKNNLKRNDIKRINLFMDRLISPSRCFLRQMQFIVLVVLYENDKFSKITAILKGIVDGNKMYKKEV